MAEGRRDADQRFTLQISASEDFADPYFEVRDTACNFHNFIPELKGARTWYWRVGYNVGTDGEAWSAVRRFTLADDAVVWDRSHFGEVIEGLSGHPRILFSAGNRAEALDRRSHHPFSEELAKYIIGVADKTLNQGWYQQFPETDAEGPNYMQMGRSLVFVAFAHLLTADEAYAGFKDRFLTMASWPPGGFSSPEGMVKGTDKWPTHLTEYFGLFYDWFHDELTPDQRATIRGSLEWRIEHTMKSFAWLRNKGQTIGGGSIAYSCSSHPYENLMVTVPGALAICDESQIAREALEIGLHYLVGITNGFGEDEAWNEGAGYGNGKMKWLTDATCYVHTAMPELELGKNEALSAYCDFFARLTPLGAQHSSFGNRGFNPPDWCGSRVTNFRRVAMLCNDSQAMANWLNTRQWFRETSNREAFPYSPWIDYVLPLYANEPEPQVEENPVKLFPLEGWVAASSAPPSDLDAQKSAVSMVFHCRPRGGYSHSFRSENAFDIHAYGATIAVGGGSTSNQSHFANHTMSHNTLLVNGMEQVAAKQGSAETYGRIIAFQEGPGYAYWAGDATAAYGKETGLARFVRHVVFVDGAYFVILDDLALADGQPPGTFQWLYHTVPDVPLDLDRERFRLRYAIGDTRVVLQHLLRVDDLTYANHPGVNGMVNPVTGEDVTMSDKWLQGAAEDRMPKPVDANHIWISHNAPRREMQFLAVVVPFRAVEAEPEITAVEPLGVRVSFRGEQKTIVFGEQDDADIVVQSREIAARALRNGE